MRGGGGRVRGFSWDGMDGRGRGELRKGGESWERWELTGKECQQVNEMLGFNISLQQYERTKKVPQFQST